MMAARASVAKFIDLNSMRPVGLGCFPAMIVKPFAVTRGLSASLSGGGGASASWTTPKKKLGPTKTIDRWFASGLLALLAASPLRNIVGSSSACLMTNAGSPPASQSLT
jgi:hypothetical protein